MEAQSTPKRPPLSPVRGVVPTKGDAWPGFHAIATITSPFSRILPGCTAAKGEGLCPLVRRGQNCYKPTLTRTVAAFAVRLPLNALQQHSMAHTPTEPSPARPHSIIKKSVYLLGAHGLREVLQSLFLIMLARMYPPSVYGHFMLALNMGSILLFVAEFGLNQHLATLLARKADYPSTILKQITVVKSVLLSTSWVGMLIFILWQEYSFELAMLIIIVATGVGLEAVASSYYVACQLLDRQDVESKWRALSCVLSFGYGITTLAMGMPALVVAWFKLIETAAASVGAVFATLRRSRAKFRIRQLAAIWQTWRGGIIYTVMAVAAIFYNKMNLFFLQKYGGAEGVAQYSVTWQIVDFVAILISGTLLRRVLFPLFVKLWVTNRAEFYRLARNTSRYLIALALPTSFFLGMEADWLIPLVFGPNFEDAVWMQPYLVGTILAAFLHNLAHYLMISIQRERLLLVFYLFGLALNLILCMTLIPPYPLLGTALAILITKVAVGICTVGFCQWRLRMIPGRSLFHLILASLLSLDIVLLGLDHMPELAAMVGLDIHLFKLIYLPRLVTTLLAVLPFGVLIWQWRKTLDKMTLKSI